jgi:hypothetical protein
LPPTKCPRSSPCHPGRPDAALRRRRSRCRDRFPWESLLWVYDLAEALRGASAGPRSHLTGRPVARARFVNAANGARPAVSSIPRYRSLPRSSRVASVPRSKEGLYEIARLAAHNRCGGPLEHPAKTGQGGAPGGRCTHQGSQYEFFRPFRWAARPTILRNLLATYLREICDTTPDGCGPLACGAKATARSESRPRRQARAR